MSGDFWGSQEGCQGPSRPSGGLQGLHQSSWLVEPRAGPVPTGLSELPQSLGEYHGGFSASEVGSLAGTEALFTIKVYLQDHICELVLESLLTEF